MYWPYSREEDAVLLPYVTRPVTSWSDVLARLPTRSLWSARRRLYNLRRKRGMVWKIPTGAAAQNWREAA